MPEEPPDESEDEEVEEQAPKFEGGWIWFWPGALLGLELGG